MLPTISQSVRQRLLGFPSHDPNSHPYGHQKRRCSYQPDPLRGSNPIQRILRGCVHRTSERLLGPAYHTSTRIHKSVFLVATCATTSDVLGFIRYNVIDPSAVPVESEAKPERQLSLEARRPKPKPHLAEIWERFEDPRKEEKDACYANIHQGCRHTCMFRTGST